MQNASRVEEKSCTCDRRTRGLRGPSTSRGLLAPVRVSGIGPGCRLPQSCPFRGSLRCPQLRDFCLGGPAIKSTFSAGWLSVPQVFSIYVTTQLSLTCIINVMRTNKHSFSTRVPGRTTVGNGSTRNHAQNIPKIIA